ncbi:type I polyketide synthase [uncultured Sphingomonas sp.]|uniref:type I polyketide synthase n=1 Tax=uncultured Sphingomonas sp. TaxID=158754 RepID=UPI0025D30114|nr:type I polyketide synthase [uncultured Sphingomonas sp.]
MNRSRYDFDLTGVGDAGNEPIAIVGASCRLPGAPDVESFWQLLLSGTDAVSEIPDDRWNKAQLFHPEKGQKGKAYTFAAGALGDVSRFDPAFFGISPREATQMDPQQRLLLELAYEAMEDAGIDVARLAGEPVGVFVGGSSWDYSNLNVGDPSAMDAYSMIGVTLCSMANRISYVFDLHGPSFTVDTACSSSLVALHQACEAIRGGQVSMGLVGGVSLLLAPQSYIGFCAASMLSPTGRCHAFDARADGYVRAEGGGVVILKPLGSALAAGDQIRAVIRGTGVNSDGRTTGLSLPNREAQAALLDQVYGRFGLDPARLGYVEAHGTGTPAGDPIEAGALGEKLGRRRSEPLTIGSVKTNIGHLEAGSGMAGLIKAMLVAERGTIPPSLHNETPNPNIPFEDLNLRLAREATPLRQDGQPRLIGINSFGFGGTNAHAVLETPDPHAFAASPAGEAEALPPFLLSARSDAALHALARSWADRLVDTAEADLPALVRGLALKRSQHMRRLVIPATTRAELIDALTAFAEGKSSGLVQANSAVAGGVGFIFSGNGSQWVGMATDALAQSAAFREALDEVDAALRPWLGWSVAQALADQDAARLRNTDVAQPLLFAIQVALVKALGEHGLHPDACMGHSVGEVAAAYASGALDLASAARVIAARSRRQQQQHGVGAMAVLGMDAAEVAAALSIPPLNGAGVEVAAHNSAGGTTVAGPVAAIDLLEAQAQARGWRFTRLDLDYAFHSAAMDPIAESLSTDLAGLDTGATAISFYSTVSGGVLDGRALDADYWWRNVRAPVLFAQAARAMVADGIRLFVEVGPHAVLQAYLTDALRREDREGRVLPSLGRRPVRHDPVAAIAARAHAAGADIRAASAFVGPVAAGGLPAYPWQRESYWVPRTEEATDLFVLADEHPLLGTRVGEAPVEWRKHLGLALEPWIADHAVGGGAVVPAAALIDMALAAARARHPDAASVDLLDVEIGRALVLEAQTMREVRFRIGSAAGDFTLTSRPRLSEEPWTVHMSGRIAAADTARVDPVEIGGVVERRVTADTLYALAADMGLDYGPAFQAVSGIDVFAGQRALVSLDRATPLASGFLLPPNSVDGALQGLLALAADRLGSDNGVLPWRFGRVRLYGARAVPVTARLAVTRVGPRSVRADVQLLDGDDIVVAEMAECWFVRVALGRAVSAEEHVFHTRWIASADPEAGAAIALPSATDLAEVAPAEVAPAEAQLLAEAFAAAAALEAVTPLAEAGLLSSQALVRRGDLSAAGRPVFDRMMRWLAADGLAEQQGDGDWRLTGEDLPPSGVVLQTLFFDAPDAVAETSLLALAAEALPATLRGVPAPALPAALWDQLLETSPSSLAASAALIAEVRALARGRTDGAPLRILNVGARRGAFAARLLRALAGEPGIALVAATDADTLPVLADTLGDSARAIAWTPGDTAPNARFDLVVGLHAGAVGGWGVRELAALRDLLASGGALLLAEPRPSRVWQMLRADLVLGDDARWQGNLEAAGWIQPFAHPVQSGAWPVALVRAVAPQRPVSARHAVRIALLDDDAATSGLRTAIEAAGGQVTDEADAAPHLALLIDDAQPLDRALARIAALAATPARDAALPVTILARGVAEGDPRAAAIRGARRVLANEAAQLATRLVLVDPALPADAAGARMTAELVGGDAEQEVVWSASGRVVPRVRRGLPARAQSEGAIRLAVARPGLLDSLGWTHADRAAPGEGELAIRIEAAGLNFRDVMWAMGLLPDEALLDGFAGPTMGLECAGTVTAVGPGVDGFAIGDRVMAFAPASLSTETVTKAHAVMRMPADMGFAAAATIPVAFLTTVYALGHLARIEAGETVLIHGGAGGVGLAAIQYARHRGARVFATAGSPTKRALLRTLGVEAVLDSRSLTFADEVMRLTDNAGVDVVLNSLSGEAMRRSLAILKPFGRFLELGKRDFYENSAIGLRPFRHNVTYYGIDADQLPLKRPALAAALFDEIAGLFADGALRPLPHRLFDYADVEDAFRLMQGSGHIGKIVLTPGAVPPVAAAPAPAFALRGDHVHLVTGGLDGFGKEAAYWLVRNGARRLALLSRRGAATPGSDALLAAFAGEGVDARAYAVDVSNGAALTRVLATIRAEQGPIGGVVHAAVAMDDALLGQLDQGRFARALAPKLGGADLLDRLTRDDAVDLFLLFSSVTTAFGNPGQGNYVAANSAIEAVAERRRAAGLPALAVQWGPIGDAGYLARETQVSAMLSRQLGSAHMSAAEALDTLPALLASGQPTLGMATIRWGALKGSLPLLDAPQFADMDAGASEAAAEVDLAAMLAECSAEEALARVTSMLVEEVARIMKLAPERIEPQRPLAEFGMDSLMAVELRLAVEQRFGVSIPLLALSEGATLGAMAGRIVRGLAAPQAEPADDQARLAERLTKLEGGPAGPADGAEAPSEPSYAAAGANAP